MIEDRFKVRATVYILFRKNGKILLYRRVNTDWKDGMYNFPGGHLEEGETILEAAVREAMEEAGLEVLEKDLRFIHVMHRFPRKGISLETNRNIIDIFFEAENWQGEPRLTEENKSDDMIWADLDNLPQNLLKFEKFALNQIKNNSLFSIFSG